MKHETLTIDLHIAAGEHPDMAVTEALTLGSLHPGILDPQMDSMRILSETAMAFPEALSFSSGAPYDGDYDLTQINHYLERYLQKLRTSGMSEAAITRRMFHYGPVNGFILPEISRMLKGYEAIDADPKSIMVTNGFQEGLLIALRGIFASPDDVLLTVSPTYVGVLGAARMLNITVEGVLEGPEGLEPEAVETAVRRVRATGRRPRALYLIPDFSNPSGTVIPAETRLQLLNLAEKEDLVILEDNPYGLFSREGEELPTIKSLDENRRVIYLGSFAKSAFPGARIGFLVADQRVPGVDGRQRFLAEELSTAKAMFSVGTSSISQAVIGGLLEIHGYDLRSATIASRDAYIERLDTAVSALSEHFPPADHDQHGVTWNTPSGGFFLVLKVPFEADMASMERSARDYGVSWAPMRMFYTNRGGEQAIRLGISNLQPDAIRAGIARLARLIKDTADAGMTVETAGSL